MIEKALSKHPQQRYPGILVFARALERACRGAKSDTISAVDGTVIADEPDSTPNWRIFLSHAESSDITRLSTDLTLRNLEVLHEEASESQDTLSPSQEERTRRAIRAAQVVLLVLTPHTRTAALVHDHLRIARLYRRRILCLWQEGETLQELLPAGAEAVTILDARGPRYNEAIEDLIQAIKREQRGVTNVAPVPPDRTFEPRNPYKALPREEVIKQEHSRRHHQHREDEPAIGEPPEAVCAHNPSTISHQEQIDNQDRRQQATQDIGPEHELDGRGRVPDSRTEPHSR